MAQHQPDRVCVRYNDWNIVAESYTTAQASVAASMTRHISEAVWTFYSGRPYLSELSGGQTI